MNKPWAGSPVVHRKHFWVLGKEDFSPTCPPCQAVTQARIVLPYRSFSLTWAQVSAVQLSASQLVVWTLQPPRGQALLEGCSPHPDVCPSLPQLPRMVLTAPWQGKGLGVNSSSLHVHPPVEGNIHYNSYTTAALKILWEIIQQMT